jgi:hypothetical protein
MHFFQDQVLVGLLLHNLTFKPLCVVPLMFQDSVQDIHRT